MLDVLERLARAGVSCWLDGGWGVDALVGRQTRPHADLDLVMALIDADRARDALAGLGFAVTESEMPTRFVLTDERGRAIDVHPVTFDAEGNGLQQLQDGRVFAYPAAGFDTTGTVAGRRVPCLSVEVQIRCHLGYPPDADDRQDMLLLHEALGVDLPEPYRHEPGQPR